MKIMIDLPNDYLIPRVKVRENQILPMGTNKTRVKGRIIKKLPVGRKVAALLFLDSEPEAEKKATPQVLALYWF
ncbi:hypothetical protein [Butyrivibrio sp.]|jgi:hypothetical protein|uniref:hypothetical protein n=1 Tax=Butyrivibrio sp. TaxID=28121 RepID=UPI0025B89C6C|nr:hypothetical protein [Butyrivibrio sp.]MBE5837587.1 hypothetical protein [Butyrivibrio sp.]